MRSRIHAFLLPLIALLLSSGAAPDFDLIVTGGSIMDGSGGPPYSADVGIKDGRILEIGDLTDQRALHLDTPPTDVTATPGSLALRRV